MIKPILIYMKYTETKKFKKFRKEYLENDAQTEKQQIAEEREAFRTLLIWVEGVKFGKGDIYPLGNNSLELLWKLLKRTEYIGKSD